MQIYVYDNGTKHNLIGDILDNGTPLFSGGEDAELPIADSSYRFSEIMGDDNVVVNFSMPVFFDFPIGCRINVDFIEYTLVELGNITKQNERWYDYTLTFESPAKQLSRYKFRNHVDGRLNFTLTAQPLEFLMHIITNLNQREGANNWMFGDCIVSSEKTQSFSHNTILDALNAVAQLFETEWEIVNKTISLKKVEYNKANPITLSYGKGNGFVSGIARQLSGEKAVDVLWVEGGDRNIDSQTYTYQKTISGQTQTLHANKLRLPRNAQFVYVPSTNEPDQYGNIDRGTIFTLAAWNALTPEQRAQYPDYMQVSTDEDGFGVSRTTYINNGYEESLEATDIYPKKVLTVTAVTESNPSNHFWEIQDSNNDVDYANCIIGGEQATIIFQSGMLTGKEFNWSKYTHSTKQFDIVPQEIDGITMPDRSSGYMPAVGDTFAVFHIALPQQYITNAEQELLLTACEYLYKHGEVEVEFQGTVDGIWAKNNWDALVPYFRIGGYINFTDNAFCQDGKKMRILSVKTYLSNPHSPEITLSNSSVSQSVSSELKKIPQNQVSAKNDLQQQISYTERSFRDTKETQKALEEAIENIDTDFTESISPVTVQTMQMIVGSENLQFAFGTATTTPEGNKEKVTGFNVSTWNPTYNNGTLVCLAADLKHYTIASSEVSSAEKAVSQYPYWSVSAANITPPDPNKLYYLYVVCPKTGTEAANLGYLTSAAYFTIADSPQAHTAANYFMLVGILNKQREGSRSFASMYGHTEITGNRITTDRIVSADGNTFFDLVAGEIRGNITFTAPSGSENKQLIDSIINSNTTVATASSNASSAVSTANSANAAAQDAKNKVDNLKIGGNIVSNLPHHWEVGNTSDENNNAKNYEQLKSSANSRLRTKWTYPLKQNTTYTVNISSSFGFYWIKFKNNKAAGWSGWKTGKQTFNTGSEFDSAAFIIRFLDDRNIQTQQIQLVELTVTEGEIEHEFSLSDSDVKFLTGGENILFNSSFTKDTTGWGNNAEIVTLSGVQCGRIIGEKNKVKTITRDITAIINQYPSGTRFTFSGEVMVTNYSAGTTNPFFRPYFGGEYNGSWMGDSRIESDIDDRPELVYPFNNTYFSNINGKGWCKFRYMCYFAQTPSQMSIYLYVRDVSCYLYFRNLKLEVGSDATKWNPANNDIDVLANRAIFSALQDSTDISGGLVLTNAIFLKAAGGAINSGISGLNATTAGKNPRFWSGGNYTDALNAANDSDMDVPNHSLPILLTDQGYNSNIGIFKVLPNAIAVMRQGQVVRISANSYTSTTESAIRPTAPFTFTNRYLKAQVSETGTYQSVYTTCGTITKPSSYDFTTSSFSFTCNLSQTYKFAATSPSTTCNISVTITLSVGSSQITLWTGTPLTKTQSITSTSSTYTFSGSTSVSVSAKSLSDVSLLGNSTTVTLNMQVVVNCIGNSPTYTSGSSYAEINASALTIYGSENSSCFQIAKGGFACGITSNKSLLYDAAAGKLEYSGSYFQINGFDWALTKHDTNNLSGGYMDCWRIGALVMLRLNLPKSYSGQTLIPSGYRPITTFTIPLYSTSTAATLYECQITNGGVVTSTALPNNTNGYGTITYITSDAYPS